MTRAKGIEACLQDLQDHSRSDGHCSKQKIGQRAHMRQESNKKIGKDKVKHNIPRSRKDKKDVTCFKCHEKGHYARDCRVQGFLCRAQQDLFL